MNHHWISHTRCHLVLAVLLAGSLVLQQRCDAAAEAYVIGAGDTLHISVWDNPQLTRTVLVRPDGKISLPLLNDLQASGLTPTQLGDTITTGLKAYMHNPDVTVEVTASQSFTVFVRGEVATPGMHVLRQEMTLLHLLTMVGGVTKAADLSRAYVLRQNEKVLEDFRGLVKQGDLTQNLVLKPNDLIVIPDNFDKRITVSGEVKAPQIIPFREGLTVLDVILQAGGFTDYARRNKVKIIHRNGGQPDVTYVKITDITHKGLIDENILLQPGDFVLVPRSLF